MAEFYDLTCTVAAEPQQTESDVSEFCFIPCDHAVLGSGGRASQVRSTKMPRGISMTVCYENNLLESLAYAYISHKSCCDQTRPYN